MTEIPPPPTTPRRLTRPADGRMIAGVSAGLGRHFDLDPLLFRIGFVVLALFGGSGLLLYLLLALLVPSDGHPQDESRTRTLMIIAAVVVLVVALPLAIPGALFLSPLIVLAAFVVLVYRAAGGPVDSRAVHASVIVLGMAAAIVVGFGAAIAVAFGAGTATAAVVLGAGVVLVVAAFAGGARWLIAPALIVAIPVAIVSAADLDLKGGVGERDYRPASVADIRTDYRLGVGELRLDLRDVDFPPGTTTIRTSVGLGSTQVMLPDAVCLDSEVHVGMGGVRVFGRQNEGVDIDATSAEDAPAGAPVVRIEADSGLGEVKIHRGDRFFFVGDDEGKECAEA
jgi:phage shock protein PspC (stress-responsive transcriptional regulator)/predicted membrane protein